MDAILIDDERACTESLAIELDRYCPDVNVVAKCNSPENGREAIHKLHPQLVFLDIEMPRMNGFELLESIDLIDFEVIFVTAYDQFAIKAFRFSAVDYLLKPIQKQELIEAVAKVRKRVEKEMSKEHLEVLLKNVRNPNKPLGNLAVPTMEGLDFIPVQEIVFCQSDSNYTNLITVGGKTVVISRPLKFVEAMLEDHPFYRVHQSYLVNLEHIRKYVKGQGGEVIMSNGTFISVARSKKEGLLRLVRR